MNVADLENIRIMTQVDERALELMMGNQQLSRAAFRIFSIIIRRSASVSGSEDIRSAAGRPHHGKGIGPMAAKPLYGVGLDAGSRRTRWSSAWWRTAAAIPGHGAVRVAGLA